MGPEHRWEFKDDFSFLKANWGGTHQWKLGFDFSYIPFDADNLGVPLGSYTFPKDTPYNANDKTTWPTQYTETRPRYANVPTKHLAFYVQDDWELGRDLTFNLGLRYDRQIGSFNEDLPHLQELAAEVDPGRRLPARDRLVRHVLQGLAASAATGTTSARASASPGTPREGQSEHPRAPTGSSTTTSGR